MFLVYLQARAMLWSSIVGGMLQLRWVRQVSVLLHRSGRLKVMSSLLQRGGVMRPRGCTSVGLPNFSRNLRRWQRKDRKFDVLLRLLWKVPKLAGAT